YENVSDLEVRQAAGKSGSGRAFRKTTLAIAPGVESDLVMLAEERDIFRHQLERFRPGGHCFIERLRALFYDCWNPFNPGQQLGRVGSRAFMQRYACDAGANQDLNPDPRVPAVVHGVIHETDVPPDRSTLASSAQVCLGCDCILLVTQIVADVSQ